MSMIHDGDQEHPEARCDLCGGPNITWWADSDRFNTATQGLQRGNGHILCPICFVRNFENETGLYSMWQIVPTTFRPLADAIADTQAERAAWLAERPGSAGS